MDGMRHPRPKTTMTTITSTFHMWQEEENGIGLPTVGSSATQGRKQLL